MFVIEIETKANGNIVIYYHIDTADFKQSLVDLFKSTIIFDLIVEEDNIYTSTRNIIASYVNNKKAEYRDIRDKAKDNGIKITIYKRLK